MWCMFVLKALFSSPEPLVFRRPSNMSIGKYAPGSIARSLPYPWPSTLAGAMAHIKYVEKKDGVTSSSTGGSGVYNDIEALLHLMFGEHKLYTGLAEDMQGKTLYYTPYGYVSRPIFEATVKSITRDTHPSIDPRNYRKPGVHSRIRISLDRREKTVREEHLFQENYTDPLSVELKYLVLIKASKEASPIETQVRLGGRGRVGFLETKQAKDNAIEEALLPAKDEDCSKWALTLVSPALLDKSPWDKGEPILLTEKYGKALAKLLLGQPDTENAEITSVYVPKNDPIGLQTLSPGWSTAEGKPRRPMLYIPPGTIITLKAGKDKIRDYIDRGLGEETGIGWGTTIALCAD